jgi:hypothetical protein
VCRRRGHSHPPLPAHARPPPTPCGPAAPTMARSSPLSTMQPACVFSDGALESPCHNSGGSVVGTDRVAEGESERARGRLDPCDNICVALARRRRPIHLQGRYKICMATLENGHFIGIDDDARPR